jgi:hypothetical protein
MSFLQTIIIAVISAIAGPIVVNAIVRRNNSLDVVMYGAEIGIRTCDGKYVQTRLDSGSELFAIERHVKEWEIFEIVSPSSPFSIALNKAVRYGDEVALKAKNNYNFVGANLDSGQKKLTAVVPHVKEWETFTLSHPSDILKNELGKKVRFGDFFSLRAFSKNYVRYELDSDGSLSATAPHKKEWETFAFVNPAQPK